MYAATSPKITTVRAEHGMNEANAAVMRRSRLDSRILVDMIAGTEQPYPSTSGNTDLPCSPIRCIPVSTLTCTRSASGNAATASATAGDDTVTSRPWAA